MADGNLELSPQRVPTFTRSLYLLCWCRAVLAVVVVVVECYGRAVALAFSRGLVVVTAGNLVVTHSFVLPVFLCRAVCVVCSL